MKTATKAGSRDRTLKAGIQRAIGAGGVTTSIEKMIPARDIPRGQSPMELLTPREMSQNNGDTASSRDEPSNNPGS